MAKGPILQKIWDDLSDNDKKAILQQASDLEAEYMTLKEFRKTAGLTQDNISSIMCLPQSNISRLEKSSDMLLSTLSQYVEAAGGKLYLTVELPDNPPIILEGFGDLIDDSNHSRDSI